MEGRWEDGRERERVKERRRERGMEGKNQHMYTYKIRTYMYSLQKRVTVNVTDAYAQCTM